MLLFARMEKLTAWEALVWVGPQTRAILFFFFFLLYLQPAIDLSTPAVVKIPLVHKTWKIASEHSC